MRPLGGRGRRVWREGGKGGSKVLREGGREGGGRLNMRPPEGVDGNH